MARFHDHFSRRAAVYARYRPHYPPELFHYLAGLLLRHRQAWDCGTGNGQAAVGLTAMFERVVATDASLRQLAHRERGGAVQFAVALAEAPPIRDRSVDLVTAAQALHWFDVDGFYREVQRVVVPGGVLAVWGYVRCDVAPEIDAIVGRFYTDTLGGYWPPGRRYVEERYRTIAFPFDEIAAPDFSMRAQWTLGEFLGYLGTWSAVQRYVAATGTDPVAALTPELTERWGGASRPVTWPLALRVGIVR